MQVMLCNKRYIFSPAVELIWVELIGDDEWIIEVIDSFLIIN